ncbi:MULTISPECIES: hypothetical protein [unclassified Novosphingobium]|uniref:hypothetical protein n=1 Tax=unclassified Novosphingobium TaxID=2644732 RepID=UPI001356D890|nr:MULTISPECIES: hypothetical protein [unclassified Novosphingobium]
MRALFLALAATGLVAGGVPALAAPAKKAAPANKAAAMAPAAGAQATQSEHAVLYLKVLISALQSDQVKEEAKSALVGCLYENSLGKISEGMDKVIAENADKVQRDKPAEVFAVLAAVCGYKGDPTQPPPANPTNGR